MLQPHFFASFGFQIIFHPAGPVQHKKNSMLGVVVTLLSQHHARRAPKWFGVDVCCFDIFRKWAWSLLRVKEIKKSDSLLTHDFFCLSVLCWYQFWSQHWFAEDIPCCGSGRNAIHSALTSRERSQSSVALLLFTKRKQGFSIL